MPEYRRFIAYFYEYIDGKKQKNAGFAKVELRNGMWRILFRLTVPVMPEPPVTVYGFVREEGYLLGFPLGTMRVGREVAEEWACRADTPIGEGTKAFYLEQIAGIRIQSGDGRYFITMWDDEPMDPDRFVLELPRGEDETSGMPEKMKTGEAGDRASRDMNVGETGDKAFRDVSVGEAEDKMPGDMKTSGGGDKASRDVIVGETGDKMPGDMKTGGAGDRVSRDMNAGETGDKAPGDMNTGEAGDKVSGDMKTGRAGNKAPGNTKTGETGDKALGDMQADETGIKTSGDMKPDETGGKVSGDTKTDEAGDKVSGDMKTGRVGDKMPGNTKTDETGGKAPVDANAGGFGDKVPVDANAGGAEDEVSVDARTSGAGNKAPVDASAGGAGAEVPKDSGMGSAEYGMSKAPNTGGAAENRDTDPIQENGVVHAKIVAHNSCAVRRGPAVSRRKNPMEELLRARQRFCPFQDDELTDCVQIMPCDVLRLQQNNWQVGRSSFLQHGYYQYRHLLLGRMKDGRYLLGVPGIRNAQEQYMAHMFGYDRFKMSKICDCGKAFGYWVRILNAPEKEHSDERP